jgi:hypothetical protein
MPLVMPDGRNVILRCINHQTVQSDHEPAMVEGTTMRAEAEWFSLINVRPPQDNEHARLNPGYGQSVRCYVCAVCGYIELYAAEIVDPKTWKGA